MKYYKQSYYILIGVTTALYLIFYIKEWAIGFLIAWILNIVLIRIVIGEVKRLEEKDND